MGELIEKQETQIVSQPQSETASMIQMIERAALNPDVDIEKMERLWAMKERMDNRNAEVAFNAAMSQAQSEMGRVSADAVNPQTRSKYASYAALDKALRPIYSNHGFSLSFDTGETVSEMVRVVCHVAHKDGHSRSYHADMPSDGKGAKGGAVMTKTHATGSAMSYGMRYLLKLIFNVAVGEDDNDGNTDQPAIEYLSDEQQANLDALIEEVNADKSKFLAWLKVPSLAHIQTAAYDDCVRQLERKRK